MVLDYFLFFDWSDDFFSYLLYKSECCFKFNLYDNCYINQFEEESELESL